MKPPVEVVSYGFNGHAADENVVVHFTIPGGAMLKVKLSPEQSRNFEITQLHEYAKIAAAEAGYESLILPENLLGW